MLEGGHQVTAALKGRNGSRAADRDRPRFGRPCRLHEAVVGHKRLVSILLDC